MHNQLRIQHSYCAWVVKDRALSAFLNSTFSASALGLIIGLKDAREIWETLKRRFTSISRSNVLNLKNDLHSIKKENNSIAKYLQKIKDARLATVGVIVDDEELLHILIKGLPKEYSLFCFASAIRTRCKSHTFQDLSSSFKTFN
jgi:hypothetical protein